MDDSAICCIDLENIVVDLVREKGLELVNGTHDLGLNSLLAIRLVYPYIRPLPHSINTRYPRVRVCAMYTVSFPVLASGFPSGISLRYKISREYDRVIQVG
jgi:hypothetical protein